MLRFFSAAGGDLGHDGARVAAGLQRLVPPGELPHAGPARAARLAADLARARRGARGSDAEVVRVRVLVEFFVRGLGGGVRLVSHFRLTSSICHGRRKCSRAFIS